MRKVNLKDIGAPNTPQEVKRLRRQVGDMLRRYGQPVLHLHMWNLDDLDKGTAQRCPACSDDLYGGQTRTNCPICFGIGFASTALDGFLTTSGERTSVDTGITAPAFGGFAEAVLTRVMEPDVAEDVFRISDQGLLTRTEVAQGVAYYDPPMSDNDLMVDVELASSDFTVVEVSDRYQLKMVSPHSIRGWGNRSHSRVYTCSQTFEMERVPTGNVLYRVPLQIKFDS